METYRSQQTPYIRPVVLRLWVVTHVAKIFKFCLRHFTPSPSYEYYQGYKSVSGNAAAQWLRPCATNRKVADSIPEGVTGLYHCHNSSGRAQPLTKMSTRNISWR
jgi:hypothetical protein